MENNMKKICDGIMTKDEVVRAAIEMYQRAFQKAECQSQVLIDSLANYMNDEPLDVTEVL
jgi:DNA topoisomerase IA